VSSSRLRQLAQEAESYGWLLLARYRAGLVTYVLATEEGEKEFNTLDEVQAAMRRRAASSQ
jgi:hypothetical protein